jgi:hypothetical protein
MGEEMGTHRWIGLSLIGLLAAWLPSCGSDEDQVKIQEILAKPKTYVGSEECKFCHLEHYDSWTTTLHSRTIQDVTKNRDALIVEIDPELIRADLKTQNVPTDKLYIPKAEEIKYTVGMQWKQGFLVEKNGILYVAPIQYNARTGQWFAYKEDGWDQRPWSKRCGGCHTTGVDIEKDTFSESSVGCEACHGPGSHHVALPETAVFDKHLTIINPSHLPAALRCRGH